MRNGWFIASIMTIIPKASIMMNIQNDESDEMVIPENMGSSDSCEIMETDHLHYEWDFWDAAPSHERLKESYRIMEGIYHMI